MMDFFINGEELDALSGLPHIQQLTYLRGIRPYMDAKTKIVGIKRRISYQSMAEQLYVEPFQGIKSQRFSRDQMRRAVSGLERASIIAVESEGLQLILKCKLASAPYSVQNKAAINPPQKAATKPPEEILVNTGLSDLSPSKADIGEPSKAATPLIKDNYIYLFSYFEKFWSLYPEKKSKQAAWEIFRCLNPDVALCEKMLSALSAQIANRETQALHGHWLPPWKYPANWLSKACWDDELDLYKAEEKRNAEYRKNSGAQSAKDPFWNPAEPEERVGANNVLQFKR